MNAMSLPLMSLDRTLPSLAANLALDEVLLRRAEEAGTGELLRFWGWPEPGVVLGAGGEVGKDVHLERCTSEGVPIHRRSSGGGTVLLGKGCLLFSLVLSVERAPELKHVNASYRWILEKLAEALAPFGAVRHEGICDLAIGGKKFSGNAQQRKQRFILHHGTLLYDFDLAKISHYLKLPERQPEYREDRTHGDFVMNLPADSEALKRMLRESWGAVEGTMEFPVETVEQLVAEKYSREEWVFRR
jgi:lipoate-protein ligase A